MESMAAWAALCEARTGPARGPGHSENWRPRRPRPHPIIILCHWPRRRAGSATCRCVQMTVMDPAREGAAISESGQYPERRLPLCCCGSLLRRRPGNGQPPWPQHTRREGRCPSRVDQVAAPPRGRARPQRRAGMAGHGTTTRQSAVARSQEESAALALVRARLGSGARGGSFVMWPEARTLRVSNSVDGRGIPRFKARRRGRARCVPLGTRAHEPLVEFAGSEGTPRRGQVGTAVSRAGARRGLCAGRVWEVLGSALATASESAAILSTFVAQSHRQYQPVLLKSEPVAASPPVETNVLLEHCIPVAF